MITSLMLGFDDRTSAILIRDLFALLPPNFNLHIIRSHVHIIIIHTDTMMMIIISPLHSRVGHASDDGGERGRSGQGTSRDV